jgi:hypothetical protein
MGFQKVKTVQKPCLNVIYNHSKLDLFDKGLTLHRFKDITFVGSYST